MWVLSNSLCDEGTQGCVGFPSGSDSCPSGPVVCLDGELVVQSLPVAKGYEYAVAEVSGGVITTAGNYPATIVTLDMVNPYCEEALVVVHHELALEILVSDLDSWGWYCDYSCVNATFLQNARHLVSRIAGH